MKTVSSNKALRYAKRLIGFDSTSDKSNQLISQYLEMKLVKHGFVVERTEYRDHRGVRKVNLVGRKGNGSRGLAYCGHSDVVPATNWTFEPSGPFEPYVTEQRLYGRGSCDMKGSLACMLTAAQSFDWDEFERPFYFVVTADEEVGFVGARHLVEDSKLYREMVDQNVRTIIGEPTSLRVVHAHKGSIRAVAIARGVAGHSSTREAVNANLKMIPFLAEMKAIHDEAESETRWQNTIFDPPTLSWNIGIQDDSPALNVTAANSVCTMYLRPMTGIDVEPLLERVRKMADRCGLELVIDIWGTGMFVDPGSEFVRDALKLAGHQSSHTVCFGTDGGVFTELEHRVVCGPGDIAQGHTADEWIDLEQLQLGTELYTRMLRHGCINPRQGTA